MDDPCTSGMNELSSTSTCSTTYSSKIPVLKYKRKIDVCTSEPKVKRSKLMPIELLNPIVEIREDDMYLEEPIERTEIIPTCSQVQDIRSLFQRFQEFNTKMVSLNQSLYLHLGLYETYDKIEKQLTGFLGELHYYREKEEALNNFYRYSSEKD